MATIVPSNQVAMRVGNTFSVSAYVPGMANPSQPITFCYIITFPGIPYTAPPNVLLTSASVHFIASPIWIETNRFGLCVDRKTQPASIQSLNIYMLIQGALAATLAKDTLIDATLQVVPVESYEELLRLGGDDRQIIDAFKAGSEGRQGSR
jgi:hypothetical protein